MVRPLFDIHMAYLPQRMDAGVGAAGHDNPCFRHSQHLLEGGFQIPLHGPPAGLLGPSGESGAVVGEVEPDAHGNDLARPAPAQMWPVAH